MNLGENIYRLRSEKNMSQGDLADALDVSRQSVSKWENNSATPELDKLIKMSQLFDITLDQLVGVKTVEPQSTPEPVTQEIYIHTPAFPARKIVGIVLFCAAFLIFLLFALSGQYNIGAMFALPFVLCGVVCFALRRYTGVGCAWALYLVLSIILPSITGSGVALGLSPRRILINTVFVELPIMIYTVLSFRDSKIHLGKRSRILYILGWIIYTGYLALRIWATFAGPLVNYGIPILCNPLHFALLAALITVSFCIQPKS